tara:strand:- start:669 stop:851 length:183 start_codon:yes stop_codon:yes gene_type:complete
MSKTRLIGSVEVTINETLRRLSKIEGNDKQSLHNEFKEWIEAIESKDKKYDVLYINKINI